MTPRIGFDYSFTENLCSWIAIIIMIVNTLFPFVISGFYWFKLKSVKPLPDLDPAFDIH
jgi:hypothetical protein